MSTAVMSKSSDTSIAPAITGPTNLSKAYFVLGPALQPWKPTILSYASSLATTFSGYPLDTLKTRMQTHKFKSTFDCLQKTLKHEGILGLFRGLTSPLITASISKSLGVSLYTKLKPQVAQFQRTFYTPLTKGGTVNNENILLAINNFPIAMCSGSLAGVCVSLFACPFEFNKLFSQISRIVRSTQKTQTHVPKNMYQFATEIVRYEGFKGFYSGYRFHVMRDFVSYGLYFAIYETFKITLSALRTDNGKIKGTNIPAGQLPIVLSGAAAGMISWFVVFPIDTLKSMTQRDIVSNILRSRDGLEKLPVEKRHLSFPTRRMYRGFGPSITRSIFTTMIFFSVYEYLMAHIG